jgi:uncharacterized membrane protein YoaK (UPF0700 family)
MTYAKPQSHDAESIAVSAMVAAAGGFLDAFTYIGHGHVFANAMTGNVVLLGVQLGLGNVAQAQRHLVPIIAFIAGIVFARALHRPRIARIIVSPHLACVILETAFLFVVGWLPTTFPDDLLTLGVAFVGSIQLSTFSTVRGAAYASTFTSGNLRKFAESAFALAINPHDEDARVLTSAFAVLCAAFFVGASIGSLCTLRFHNHAAWVVAAWLGIVLWRLLIAYRRAHLAVSNGESAGADDPPRQQLIGGDSA